MSTKSSSRKILVVAAHPDDEALGCGGTIAKHAREGDHVEILIVAEGITSRSDQRNPTKDKSALSELAAKAKEAGKVLGAKNVNLLGFSDNRLDSMDLLDLIKPIEEKITSFNPEIIYTHHRSDLNIDHRLVHDAVVTASRPLPGFSERSILYFEVPSATGWQASDGNGVFFPNWFVDISTDLQQKMKALEIYKSEMRDWPHIRSKEAVEHLAKWRGASVGVEAAEAFVLGRHLVG